MWTLFMILLYPIRDSKFFIRRYNFCDVVICLYSCFWVMKFSSMSVQVENNYYRDFIIFLHIISFYILFLSFWLKPPEISIKISEYSRIFCHECSLGVLSVSPNFQRKVFTFEACAIIDACKLFSTLLL